MKKKFLSLLVAVMMCAIAIFNNAPIITIAEDSNATTNVAKVGNTEYATIDEAIAAWTNNTTLTLLADVTLSDTITIKSTEHHILNLATYTMTAADSKNAIVIQACGTGDSERTAITIQADATNPGTLNAGKKCCIYYKYKDGGISGNDRPIIKIEGGVFVGSTSSFGSAGIYTIGSEARKCATLNVSGGIFNCSINGSGKSKLLISGGTFNYSVGSQGDSTAYRLISGGKFKTGLGFVTADSNNTKFWIGTEMAKSDCHIYIDDAGYTCIVPPSVSLFEKYSIQANVIGAYSKVTGIGSYLQYSSASTVGVYYVDAKLAYDHYDKGKGKDITFYGDAELEKMEIKTNLDVDTLKGEVIPSESVKLVNESTTFTVIYDNEDVFENLTVLPCDDNHVVAYTDVEATIEESATVRNRTYYNAQVIAKVTDSENNAANYASLVEAYDAAKAGDTITIISDVTQPALKVEKDITINLGIATAQVTISFEESKEPNLTVTEYSDDYNLVINESTENGIITRTYSNEMKPYVAQVGTEKYTSLQKAYNAAQAGATITISKDIDEVKEPAFVIDKDITIDLNDKTYTIIGSEVATYSMRAAVSGLQIAEGANVTIKNGTIASDVASTLIENSANLTLENVTLESKNLALANNGGSTEIKNSTIVGEVNLNAGSLVDDNATHTESGRYVQMNEEMFKIDDYNFTLTLDKTAIQANDKVNVTVSIDKDYYAAEYTFKYDKAMFTCGADLDDDGVIYVTGLYEGQAGDLATYTLTAKNDLQKVSNSAFSVTGNVVQYFEQTLNAVNNPVTDGNAQVKVSLDYLVAIKADYVSGYSLVLVSGEDGGYAYNGEKMFFVEAYDAYAFIVKGEVTAEIVDAALSKVTDCEIIAPSYNVNAEFITDGKVDLKDATLVYACAMLGNDFNDVAGYIEIFLRADVNGDKIVNMIDINLVTLNYTK